MNVIYNHEHKKASPNVPMPPQNLCISYQVNVARATKWMFTQMEKWCKIVKYGIKYNHEHNLAIHMHCSWTYPYKKKSIDTKIWSISTFVGFRLNLFKTLTCFDICMFMAILEWNMYNWWNPTIMDFDDHRRLIF